MRESGGLMMMASTGRYANNIHGRDHATNAREPTKPRTALIGQFNSDGGSDEEIISHQNAMSCLRQADINQLDICSSAPPPGYERVRTFGQAADNAASLYVSSAPSKLVFHSAGHICSSQEYDQGMTLVPP